jgi:hypothetical protein
MGIRLMDIPGAEDESKQVEIDVGPRVVGARGERRVVEPAGVGTQAERKAGVQENARQHEDPVRQRIQPGERHITGSQKQRPQVVAEARQDRAGIEEDHGEAVHGEQLIVGFGGQDLQIRMRQLHPHDQRLDSAGDQEHECRDDVADSDPFMIDTGEEPANAGRRFPDDGEPVLECGHVGFHRRVCR